MDNKKMGELIADLRKEKGITQKELAERLNVTDKAVSKWERGNGYPEITIIQVLAGELGVSVNELLNGKRDIADSQDNDIIDKFEADKIVSKTAEYIQKSSRYKFSGIAFALLSIVFLIGIFVSLLCNYAISRRFDWSLYPAGAILVAWISVSPLFMMRKNRVVFALIGMMISLIPYLFLVEYLCPSKGWVIPLALPAAGLSFAVMLIIAYLFVYTKINRLYVVAVTFLLAGVILNPLINSIVNNYLTSLSINTADLAGNDISVISVVSSSALISIILAVLGFIRGQGRRKLV